MYGNLADKAHSACQSHRQAYDIKKNDLMHLLSHASVRLNTVTLYLLNKPIS